MSANSPIINVAVIDVCLIGPGHCKTEKESTETNLMVIVDPQPSTGSFPKSSGSPTTEYGSVQELTASPHKPDAAIVCAPDHTHVSLAKELSAAGVHSLSRSPCLWTLQAEEIS